MRQVRNQGHKTDCVRDCGCFERLAIPTGCFPRFVADATGFGRFNRWRRDLRAIHFNRSIALKPTNIPRVFRCPPLQMAYIKTLGSLGVGLALSACQVLLSPGEFQSGAIERSAPSSVPSMTKPLGADEPVLWDGLGKGGRPKQLPPKLSIRLDEVINFPFGLSLSKPSCRLHASPSTGSGRTDEKFKFLRAGAIAATSASRWLKTQGAGCA